MRSAPFVPARVVGGSVLVERKPFHDGGVLHFRGVEIIAEAPSVVDPTVRGPYRTPSPAPPPTTRRVEVCEALLLVGREAQSVSAFQEVVAQLASLAPSPAPRVLQVLAREGRARALILEQLQGAELYDLVRGLHERGERIPVPLALAIAGDLIPLWQVAGSTTIWVGSADVVLSPLGRVRVRPWVPTEFHLLDDLSGVMPSSLQLVCNLPPESIPSGRRDERSRTYALGMLLYEMLAGGLHGIDDICTLPELVQWIRAGVRPIQEVRPDLPPAVATFVSRAIARDPADRFAAWSELSVALDAVRSSLAPTHTGELATWLRSLPAELRPEVEPPIDIAALGDWRRLPRASYEPLAWPGSPSDGGVG